jgi:hypothetical protein
VTTIKDVPRELLKGMMHTVDSLDNDLKEFERWTGNQEGNLPLKGQVVEVWNAWEELKEALKCLESFL